MQCKLTQSFVLHLMVATARYGPSHGVRIHAMGRSTCQPRAVTMLLSGIIGIQCGANSWLVIKKNKFISRLQPNLRCTYLASVQQLDTGTRGPLKACAWRLDGVLLATGGCDSKITLWKYKESDGLFERIVELPVSSFIIRPLHFSDIIKLLVLPNNCGPLIQIVIIIYYHVHVMFLLTDGSVRTSNYLIASVT